MSAFTVISFYTQDWEYPTYAQRLISDCQRLDLDHSIQELPSDGDYVKNCNKKPAFILEQLKKLQRPVMWVDADGSIVKTPTRLQQPDTQGYDIAGNQAQWDDSKIHVGSIWFNYTPAAIDLLEDWQQRSSTNDRDDDVAFNDILGQHPCKILMLPPEYFIILKSNTAAPPEDAVIVHRLSTGASKEQYKKILAGAEA